MATTPTTFRPGRACGHDDCGTSTGLCGRLTFGRGRLDDHGYWTIPCAACAAAFATAHPDEAVALGGVWPATGDPVTVADKWGSMTPARAREILGNVTMVSPEASRYGCPEGHFNTGTTQEVCEALCLALNVLKADSKEAA